MEMSMRISIPLGCLLSMLTASVFAASPIECTAQSANVIASIWPTFYLSDSGALCFNVKSWAGFTGSNCVTNGKGAHWTGTVIVSEDTESRGRDETAFRVLAPVVTADQLRYTIEWSRGAEWRPMQNVEVNRITGEAVSWFVTMHGGDSYKCVKGKKAL